MRKSKSSKKTSIAILIVLALLIVFFGAACFVSFPIGKFDYKSVFGIISKGIDLEGGYYAVLTPSDGKTASAEDLDAVIETIRKRLDDNGYTEATIARQDNGLRVEIPEVEDPDELMNLIGDQGELEFRNSNGDVKVKGEHVKNATCRYSPDDGQPVVYLEFTEEGSALFAAATEEAASASTDDGKKISIYLGDSLISSPTVSEKITGGVATITGIDDIETAQTIASVIKSGALSIDFSIGESKPISATLGENVLNKALLAAAIGLVAIFVIMIVIYGGMGVASSIALMIYVILYVCILAIFPGVQLTFPGIAGIILSIGMAVDANVVIFERIKDEYASTDLKQVDVAVRGGFKRAVVTVLDSNVTILIASAVLWIFCSGSIKGFAITLFLGVVVSLFTAIFVTRWIMNLIKPLVAEKDGSIVDERLAKLYNLRRRNG